MGRTVAKGLLALLLVVAAAMAQNATMPTLEPTTPSTDMSLATSESNVTTAAAPYYLIYYRVGLVDSYELEQAKQELFMTFHMLRLGVIFKIGSSDEIMELSRVGKVEVVYSSSEFYSCLSAQLNIPPVASVVRRQNGVDTPYASGVMFTSSKHENMELADMKGTTLAAVSRDSFLGFQAQRHELARFGFDAYDTFAQIIFTRSSEQVVWEVLNGTVDVGFLPSGVIEKMVSEGKIYTPNVRFLNEYNHRLRDGTAYPYRSSTSMYGDWVMSAVKEMSETAVHTAISALFTLDNSHFTSAGIPSISYWRPALAFADTLAMLADLNILVTNGLEQTCTSLSPNISALVCPVGYKHTKDITCEDSDVYDCPVREGFEYECVCAPCEPICGSSEVYDEDDDSCDCQSGHIPGIYGCIPLGVFAAQVLIPVAVLIGLLVFFLIHRQHLKADGIWQIKPSELVLEQPAEVLGSGSFGVVLAAKMRGQTVAVKRAYVSKHSKYSTQTKSSLKTGTASNAFGLPLRLNRHSPKDRDRVARQQMRHLFIEAEASTKKNNSIHGSSLKSSRATTMAAKPWYERLFGPSDETRARRQLFREMRLLSRMQHDNICRMLGAVVESGIEPLMVLEYMEMGSLYSMLHNEAMELDDEFRYNAICDISTGMRYLHNSDLVHGDLKTLNCLVDGKFHVKVSDFGMASFASENTQQGGTLAWMAPELLQGATTSFASDVYSFGIVMFEIFSREDPYEDVDYDSATLVQNILRRKLRPTPPSSMPPEFVVLMNESLSTDPDMRPTFVELIRRIEPMEGKMKIKSGKGGLQDNALLEQVFPKHIAAALREGRTVEPEHHAEVTIFFSDICGFTDMSATLEPVQVSNMLDRLYTVFDKLCDKHGLYKIETIGDAYMCVGNLFTPQPDHAARVARFAMDALAGANAIPILEDEPDGDHIDIRVGFHSGPVVSNVVGTLTPRFCLFGSTVNCASRMESNSVRNCIHMSPEAAALVQKQDVSLNVIRRDPVVTIKGLGKMQTYWLGHAPSTQEAVVAKPARKSLSSIASARSSRRASMQKTSALNPAQRVVFDDVTIDMSPSELVDETAPRKSKSQLGHDSMSVLVESPSGSPSSKAESLSRLGSIDLAESQITADSLV